MSLENSIESLKWRYATKAFDPSKKVSDEKFEKILDAGILSPSSFGLQPWKFFAIKDPTIRAKLKEQAWNQSQVTDASHLIVIASKSGIDEAYITKFIEQTASERGIAVSDLAGYKQMMLGFIANMPAEVAQAWMTRQTYIALGILMSVCAAERIDTCPMEGFDPQKFDQILGLAEKGYNARVMLAVGYRSDQDKYAQAKKIRLNKAEVVTVI